MRKFIKVASKTLLVISIVLAIHSIFFYNDNIAGTPLDPLYCSLLVCSIYGSSIFMVLNAIVSTKKEGKNERNN